MNDLDQSKPSIVTIAKSDMDNLSEIATGFIQVITDKSKNELELHEREIKFKEKELEYDQSVFKYKFWLLAGGLISIVSISAGLIFYSNNPSLGVGILTHIGAIIGGVVAGVGYESSKTK